MSDTDQVHEALEAIDYLDGSETSRRGFDRRAFLRRTALTGVAAGSVGTILNACGSSASSGGGSSNVFGSHKSYKFVFVNHVTTNPFFTPTQYGAADACKLLGCSYQWTGSENSNVSQMVNALNTAVTSGADGIAVALTDLHAFNAPVEAAIKAGIPVVAYNADAAGNARFAYIGQDLKLAGEEMGKRIVSAVGSGQVGLFIATPGSANLQPRIEGAEKAIRASGKSITLSSVATGTVVAQEQSAIEAWYLGHKSAKGMYAVDAGSTQGVAQTIQKHNLKGKVMGGGYDLTPITQQLLAAGQIQFTIDQQPYLQGFFPILELYLYNVTQKLTGTADVNTGLKFLDKTSVAPYNSTKSRYEGTSTSAGVTKS